MSDIISFRAYANWIREYIPNFVDLDMPLRRYCKKGATWAQYLDDPEARAAFAGMRESVARSAALHVADYERARADHPAHCPFPLRPCACGNRAAKLSAIV